MPMELILGAINKTTNKYDNLKFASKQYKYKCVSCGIDITYRDGAKNFPCFVHKRTGCLYYKNPTIQQLKKDSMMLLQSVIEKNKIQLYKKCSRCNVDCEIFIPDYQNNYSVVLDYNFIHNGQNITVDIAYLDGNNKILCLFNILTNNDLDRETDYEPCYNIQAGELFLMPIWKNDKLQLYSDKQVICNNCN